MADISGSIAPMTSGRDIQAVAPAAILPFWLCVLGPWWIVYELNINEGINLIKAALVANGYYLYDQIWNDQPPGFTVILAAAHWLFPFNVGIARAINIAFSSVLLWAFFRVVRRSAGDLAAWTAVAALGLSSLFLLLSASVMIDLPAIAVAICALDQAMIGASEKSRRRLLLAGVLFGLSLQIKMFTALMLPSLICAVLFFPKAPERGEPWPWREVGLTVAAGLATFLLAAVIFREPLIAQLFSPHWKASMSDTLELGLHGWIGFGQLLLTEPILLALGIVGLGVVLARPRQTYGPLLIPAIWLCLSIVVFGNHKPLWPHHLPMTLIPMAWVGGSAVAKGVEWLAAIGLRASYRNAIVAVLFGGLIVDGASTELRFGTVPPPQNPVVAARGAFKSDAPAELWVVTDQPLDAYRAGLLVPPELAVYSSKRLAEGFLPADVIISAIREYQPSQVMFYRFPVDPEVPRFLRGSSYVRLAGSDGVHYIRRDLVRQTPWPLAPASPMLAWPN